MKRARTDRRFGFSLIELMIAIAFLVIGFFGYVALHARILHSGQRLEEKERVRAATDFYSAFLVSRAKLGMDAGSDGKKFRGIPSAPGVFLIDTTEPYSLDWLTESVDYPKEFSEGMRETMQLSPHVLATPYHYSWKKR